MIVKVNGQYVNHAHNSIDVDDAIGQRSTASFAVIDRVGNMRFKKGQQVEIFEEDGTTKVFGGVIDTQPAGFLTLFGAGKRWAIHCTDYHYLTDKRIVAKYYENMAAGQIVRDLIVKYFYDEFITVGNIQDGPIVTEAVFNYVTGTRCMEALAEKAGFEWNINPDKTLDFYERSTFIAPVTITENSKIKNITVEDEAKDYRNKQFVRAGKDLTDPQTQRFKGDGAAQSFTLGFPLGKEPQIKINGVLLDNAADVGIKGLEDGKQWYWSKGDATIVQHNEAAPLTDMDEIEITYQGLFDIVAVTWDQSEVEARKTTENNSGIYENVIDDPYATTRAAAFETANAKIKRFGKIGKKISFDTFITGLRAGQLLTIDLPSFDINNTQFLIESIQAAELGTDDGRCTYKITAVDGAATGGWADFFKKIATRGENFVLRENIKEDEVLVLLDQFNKTWTSVERPNIFAEVYPSNTLMPGAMTLPMFEPQDRVKYMTLYNATGEFYRKAITKTDASTPGQNVATNFIAPFEANDVQITHIGWIGGKYASGTIGGDGILIDKQVYNREKNNIEAIQVDKIDLRGW